MNIPLVLTFVRFCGALLWLGVAPLLLAQGPLGVAGLILGYLVLALTDWLDGFYARRYHQETIYGALLDPVADKALMVAGLLVGASWSLIPFWAVLALVMRDFLVMGMRECALIQGIPIPVSWLAKRKTALINLYTLVVLASPLSSAAWVGGLRVLLLTVSLMLSWISALGYYNQWRRSMPKEPHAF